MATSSSSASSSSSPRRLITPRDLDVLAALDRTPLTASQLLRLGASFPLPFTTERRLRERLQRLAAAGWLRSWPYATTSRGGSPRYWKLSPAGFQLLHGPDAPPPPKRQFLETGVARHHHTQALADFIVQTYVSARRAGAIIRHFARENSVTIEAGGTILRPDCGFQIVTPSGKGYSFAVELDCGTERVRSGRDVESIERKLRLYHLHQEPLSAYHPERYVVLFVTTRSDERLAHILETAARVLKNPGRTLFLGVALEAYLAADDPLHAPLFRTPAGRAVSLVPSSNGADFFRPQRDPAYIANEPTSRTPDSPLLSSRRPEPAVASVERR